VYVTLYFCVTMCVYDSVCLCFRDVHSVPASDDGVDVAVAAHQQGSRPGHVPRVLPGQCGAGCHDAHQHRAVLSPAGERPHTTQTPDTGACGGQDGLRGREEGLGRWEGGWGRVRKGGKELINIVLFYRLLERDLIPPDKRLRVEGDEGLRGWDGNE
jgi:hypothetical protein